MSATTITAPLQCSSGGSSSLPSLSSCAATAAAAAAEAERDDLHRETAATIAQLAQISDHRQVAVRSPVTEDSNKHAGFSSSPSKAATPSAAEYDTVFSSIGFGMHNKNDATEAAVKAVRDATDRSQFSVSAAARHFQNLYLHVKLGVPPSDAHRGSGVVPVLVPMNVDTKRIIDLLPKSIPILSLEVVVGGLTANSADLPCCAAVACVSLLQQPGSQNGKGNASMPPVVVPEPAVVGNISPTSSHATMPAPPASWAEVEAACSSPSSVNATSATVTAERVGSPDSLPHKKRCVNRSTSIEMLAMISAEIHDSKQQEEEQRRGDSLSSKKDDKACGNAHKYPRLPPGVTPQNIARISAVIRDSLPKEEQQPPEHQDDGPQLPPGVTPQNIARISAVIRDGLPKEEQQPQEDQDDWTSKEEDKAGGNAYNYRKLPPGITPKNNKRLFVKHSYRDHSSELPGPGELHLMSKTAPIRTPGAAFPLKLHEILRQVEVDGLDDVVGWLPHGRSFKIFKQKQFVDTILPKYFVMTKKSSFLRQLNLYGFNRLSAAGPNQGSYYHEKFLRGMKFLCRRMQRQKINGNGIRAAGNPDNEPNLGDYPPCPLGSLHQNLELAAVLPAKQQQEESATPASDALGDVPSDRQPKDTRSSPANAADASADTIPPPAAAAAIGQALGNIPNMQVSFPLKLQCILDKLEAEGTAGDIISWMPHGRAFLVHDPQRFVSEVMPVHFKQSKYSSFQRQLHMYNFERVTGPGPNKGAYHHPYFLRSHPELALKMRRTRINGKGTRRPGNPATEPDFVEMEPLPPIKPGTVVDIPMDSSSTAPSGTANGTDNKPPNKDVISSEGDSDDRSRPEDDDDDDDDDDNDDDEEEDEGDNQGEGE